MRIIIAVIATVSMILTPVMARAQTPKRAVDDFLIVIFGFEASSRDAHHNVRITRFLHPSDRSVAKAVLTKREKDLGISIIEARKYHFALSEVGKTSYDGLLFDKRARKYVRD